MVTNSARKVHEHFAVPEVAERNRSVATAIGALLDADIRDDDRRYLLDMALWRYTEFDKNRYKFAVRYRTPHVVDGAEVVIQHEHVVERKWLLDQLTAHPDRLELILTFAVACIVSKEEHDRFRHAGGFGWERYLAAGVEVVDTVDMTVADVVSMAAAQRQQAEFLGFVIPNSTVQPAEGNATTPPPIRVVSTPNSSPIPNPCPETPPAMSFDERLASLSGKTGHRAQIHRAVHAVLVDAGFVGKAPDNTKADYVSYRDLASGKNFINLTSKVAHVMRQELWPELRDVPGIRQGGRYPQVDLDDSTALSTIRSLAQQYKA